MLKASGDPKPRKTYLALKGNHNSLDDVAESLREMFIKHAYIQGVDGKMKVVLKKKYR